MHHLIEEWIVCLAEITQKDLTLTNMAYKDFYNKKKSDTFCLPHSTVLQSHGLYSLQCSEKLSFPHN